MELAIVGATVLAGLFWIATIIAATRHQESWLIWTIYFAMVFTGLVFFLNWQKAVGAKAASSVSAADKGAEIARIAMLPKIGATLAGLIFEPGKRMEVDIVLKNMGKTTASNFEAEAHIFRYGGGRLPADWNSPAPALGPPTVANLAPEMLFGIKPRTDDKIERAEFQQIRDEKIQLRVFVWGRYDDEFGGRATPFDFCWAYNREYKALVGCNKQQYAEYKASRPN